MLWVLDWLSPGTAFVFLCVFLLTAWYLNLSKYSGLPPGPTPLPVLGNFLRLAGDTRANIRQLASEYGDMVTVYMGSKPNVLLCSQAVIKEALVTNGFVFSGRNIPGVDASKRLGIGLLEGEVWQKQRAFIHQVFRDLGVGKNVMELKIQDELPFFIDGLLAHQGRHFNPNDVIGASVANIIFSMIFGKRCEYDDQTFLRHLRITNETLKMVRQMRLTQVFPFLKYLPGDVFSHKKLAKDKIEIRAAFKKMVDDKRSNLDSTCSDDFVTHYLKEIEKHKDDSTTSFTDGMLLGHIDNLFIAGAETTATFLKWAIVFLFHHPDVARRLREEIEDVIGSSRLASMKDKAHMPYTEAVTLEVLRMGDIIPLGVPHAALRDVHIGGHLIPSGTTVMPILHIVHRDPSVWPDPFCFKPDRFMDSDGNVVRNDNLIPFAMGARVCLGESLARMEIFLFFVTMMQRLEIKCPTGSELPDMNEGHVGMTYTPKNYEVCITARQ